MTRRARSCSLRDLCIDLAPSHKKQETVTCGHIPISQLDFPSLREAVALPSELSRELDLAVYVSSGPQAHVRRANQKSQDVDFVTVTYSLDVDSSISKPALVQ
jgi:hypothetical protein